MKTRKNGNGIGSGKRGRKAAPWPNIRKAVFDFPYLVEVTGWKPVTVRMRLAKELENRRAGLIVRVPNAVSERSEGGRGAPRHVYTLRENAGKVVSASASASTKAPAAKRKYTRKNSGTAPAAPIYPVLDQVHAMLANDAKTATPAPAPVITETPAPAAPVPVPAAETPAPASTVIPVVQITPEAPAAPVTVTETKVEAPAETAPVVPPVTA